MATSNDLKKGMIIKREGELYSVLDFMHVRPGRNPAFVRAKLKCLTKSGIIDVKFQSAEKVEEVEVEPRQMQFLYAEGDELVFMDTESYDQTSVSTKKVGDLLFYIKESDMVTMQMYGEEPIEIVPPTFVNLKVTYAEPAIKGDTARDTTKPVKVETGAEVRVPLFIAEGDLIKIDTRTGDYVERAK